MVCILNKILLLLDESFPASEGIWGTDVFTAFELKTLTRRKFFIIINYIFIASILSTTNGVITTNYSRVKDEPLFCGDNSNSSASVWLSPNSSSNFLHNELTLPVLNKTTLGSVSSDMSEGII